MTVCVAAIASWKAEPSVDLPVIIYAADRMITIGGTREYELLDQTKMYPIADNIKILASGHLDALLPVCQTTRLEMLNQGTMLVAEAAAMFAGNFQAHRRHLVERTQFEPRGLTIDSFMARQKEFAPEVRERLENALDDPADDLGAILIFGIDKTGAHIFTVEDPGIERGWDATGFAAVGIGAEHAETVFTSSLYTVRRDLLPAMISTFFAKKAAEEAPGVGKNTDLYYLTQFGEEYFEPLSNVVQTLDKMYAERQQEESRTIARNAQALGKLLIEERYARKAVQDDHEQAPVANVALDGETLRSEE